MQLAGTNRGASPFGHARLPSGWLLGLWCPTRTPRWWDRARGHHAGGRTGLGVPVHGGSRLCLRSSANHAPAAPAAAPPSVYNAQIGQARPRPVSGAPPCFRSTSRATSLASGKSQCRLHTRGRSRHHFRDTQCTRVGRWVRNNCELLVSCRVSKLSPRHAYYPAWRFSKELRTRA